MKRKNWKAGVCLSRDFAEILDGSINVINAQMRLARISSTHLFVGKYLHFSVPDFRKNEKKMQKEAGAVFLRLNGCPGCNDHVYLPTDPETHCPHVKHDGTVCGHPRCDENGKPLEVFFVCVCCS